MLLSVNSSFELIVESNRRTDRFLKLGDDVEPLVCVMIVRTLLLD